MIDPVVGKWDGDEKSKSRAKWRAGLADMTKARDYKQFFDEIKYLLSVFHIVFPACGLAIPGWRFFLALRMQGVCGKRIPTLWNLGVLLSAFAQYTVNFKKTFAKSTPISRAARDWGRGEGLNKPEFGIRKVDAPTGMVLFSNQFLPPQAGIGIYTNTSPNRITTY